MTAMRERPILFSALMVRAILAGTKTQTRRPIKHADRFGPHSIEQMLEPKEARDSLIRHHCPYGRPGDRLWVREAVRLYFDGDDYRIQYRADDALGPFAPEPKDGEAYEQVMRWIERARWGEVEPGGTEAVTAWRPSIHMPRWACRLTPDVTDVRVERLRQITPSDVRHEGVDCPEHDFPSGMCVGQCISLWMEFSRLWDAINAKRGYGWDADPWVWAVTFARDAGAAERFSSP